MQRKRKPGDPENKVDKHKPVIDKDGRVHHVKKVGEVAEDQSVNTLCIGSCVKITKKPHEGLYGRVVAVDADTARISVGLSISGEVISISEYNAEVVDKDELKEAKTKNQATNSSKLKSQNSSKHDNYETNSKLQNGNGNQVRKTQYDSTADRNQVKKAKHDSGTDGKPPWMHADIRVRIISKTFRGGRYYNKKVEVLDVTSMDRCMCRTDEKEILNDVKQSYIETVIPKAKGSYVKILAGKYKGQHGRLVDRNKSECVATLQLLQSKEIKKLSFDDISEFTGRLQGDVIL